jgi:uncharacterized repeat protein (TIGR03803 family)
MRDRRSSLHFIASIALIICVSGSTLLVAQTERVLHGFINKGDDGFYPYGNLIADSSGNLYSTTASGDKGSYYGTVFELMPGAGGSWKEKILHIFSHNGTDGHNPDAGLTFDSSGNLYGTTYNGGATKCRTYGCGTVFELSPQANGTWTEKVLHDFVDDGTDGVHPDAGLTLDSAGNLYGTTSQGGSGGVGTVFELTPASGGAWTEKILHNFSKDGIDGYYPAGSLIFDATGNLYGTTGFGGSSSVYGTVFEMKPAGGGRWTERVLHNFSVGSGDGAAPVGALVFDQVGNLYGTTELGGASLNCNDADEGCGTVFEMIRVAGGGWEVKILHSFVDDGIDGYFPRGNVIFDAFGNLYGLTSTGGAANSFAYGGGIVFELMPNGSGGWAEKILHSFNGENSVDGSFPQGGMIFDQSGNLYGTALYGGPGGYGAVFEIKP